ncbi:uncharacterized protein LOC134288289 [Aedes albopictus]|uniref:Uncharacterized protein n=1 Tax=Aedes albopictus TaxID=7160 RepID=A0ABM2A3T6_AEDAL
MSNRGESDTGAKKKKAPKSKGSRVSSEQNENNNPAVVVTSEPDPNQSAANKTVPGRSCKSCKGPDSGGMVQCDDCDKWHHFTCVGVSEEVENQNWSCPKCVSAKWIHRERSTSPNHLQIKDARDRPSKSDKPADSVNEPNLIIDAASGKPSLKGSSIGSTTSSRRSSRTLLKLQMEKLEAERRIEREFLDKKFALLEEMASEGSSYSSSVSSSMNRVRDWVKSNEAKEDCPGGLVSFEPQRNSTHYQQSLPPPNPNCLSAHLDQLTIGRTFSVRGNSLRRDVELSAKSTMPNDYRQSSAAVPPGLTGNCNFPREAAGIHCSGNRSHQMDDDLCPLSSKQIAARQAISKDLPAFSGKSEEWPIFYSTFTNTSVMCGFTDAENAIRLQKCLTGRAYDAVKSLLMYPSNVRRVIATLQMRFGQPEAVIHSLIGKINELPMLREDKLETIMDFAVEVQNFCSILDVCGLEEHMYNVSLLHQLVSRLPPSIKLDWARYRQTCPKVNLATFGNWMYSLAEAASTVTIPGIQEPKAVRNDSRSSKKGPGFLNAHLESGTSDSYSQTDNCGKNSDKCPVCNANCTSVDKCRQFLEMPRESRWIVVRNCSLCRRCLRKHYGDCQTKVCGKDGCSFKHHELLHKEQKLKGEKVFDHSESNPEQTSARHGCNTHGSNSSAVLFRYLPVVIYGDRGSICTFAFLDDGSELTLLDQDLADELGLEGVEHPLSLRWTGGTERFEKHSRVINVSIAGQHDGARKFNLDAVRTVKELQLPYQTLDMDEMRRQYPHLRSVPIESYERVRPRILIGMKHIHVSLVLKGLEGKLDEPIATKTRLGWTVCGVSCENTASSLVHFSYHVKSNETSDEDLHQTMKEYFALDSLGVMKPSQALLSSDDQRACKLLESSTVYNGNRYETGLLWRNDNIRLPDSRPMAIRRHHHLQKRMQSEPTLAKALNEKIHDYLQKGYIRRLQPHEENLHVKRSWYLPIFPVVNPNKPGKIRIVWDAAATTHGVSLNSALLKGPDQTCSLLAILLQFRMHRIGLTGDIREMYHQVQIRREDRPCQRFFWTDESGSTIVYEMCVMTFGASCSPCSAQYVKNINAERYASEYPQAAEVIIKKHYVDDMLVSVESEETAIQLAQEVKHVHAQGGFEIRNWISNSRAVIEGLGQPETTTKNLDLCSAISTEKVLGLWWCTESDTFTYKVGWTRYDDDLLKGQRPPTKREVLRVLMTIFDPLGLIAHFLVYLKILLQEIWRSGVQWDDKISNDLYVKWKVWLRVLPDVEHVQIPRCYHISSATVYDVELHTFVDASENAFAAVSYVRFSSGDQIECSLVAAKTRVAPLKFQSIPRLELQAAILGVRLAQTVVDSLSTRFKRRIYWTDSRDVLCWINSDHRRFTQFVAHRVSEILDATEASSWRWVPTKMNVADDATKWESQADLSNESRWFNGPSFLWEDEVEWPTQPTSSTSTKEELRSSMVCHLSASTPLLTCENFSSWNRLVRVVGFVYRFANNCRSCNPSFPKRKGPLCLEEIRKAEQFWFRQIQREAFTEEVDALSNQKEVSRSSSIFKLSPWLDSHGVLRMRGRTSHCAFITEEAKNPILLPRDHHVTMLIISYVHNKFHHHNHETVVNELRQRYWIPRIRVCYAKVRRNCQRCKNEHAAPSAPIMADLPPARLAAYARPFTHVGIDYFGPMEVAIGRRVEKRWTMLATCMTTRAVHIEIVHSLSTNSCVMAIRNMIARRGIPRRIYCDRGTNFIGTCRELGRVAELQNLEAIMSEFGSAEIEWSFNPPSSPHMGGSWERLIRSVKDNLKSLNLPRRPSDEVLRNALTEIENTLNSRPLTHVPIEDHAAPALTPNHILLGSSNGIKPLSTIDDSNAAVRQCWRTSQVIANQFWKRWLSDYLPEITQRAKWHTSCGPPIRIGDVVIIVDPKLPRNCWPKGKVIDTRNSKDGVIRSATVRTTHGVYERPVVKLAVLDVLRDEE